MADTGGSEEARKRAVARVARLISDPEMRRALADDPVGTLKDKLGEDFVALPRKVRDFFSELTYEELRVLAQLQKTMKGQEGLFETVEMPDDEPPATLAKL